MRLHLPRSLLWRLCLALIAIQVAAALGLGWYAFRIARDFQYTQTLEQLERLTSLLGTPYIELLDDADEPAALRERVSRDGRRSAARITVIQPDGTVLADSHHDPGAMENHFGRPEVRDAMNAGSGTATRFSTTVNMDMMFYARRYASGQRTVILRTAIPLMDIHADVQRLARTVALAGGLSLLFTIGLVYLVSRSLSGAVASLARRTWEFARGAAKEPIEQPPFREFAPVAEALNEMARRLNDRIAMLQAQQREHEAILQSMNSGIVALDPQQRILRTNRAADEMLGILGETAKGRLLQEVARLPELNEYVNEAMRNGQPQPAELRVRHLQERERVLQVAGAAMPGAADRGAGLLLVLSDLTALRRLEAMRSDFAANVSHELRTPITNIKGYVETLLDAGPNDDRQSRHFLEVIKRNSDRLAAIIEDILSLAWLEQPDTRETLPREITPIGRIVGAVLGQFQDAADAKRIELRVDVVAALAAPLNEQLIEQALANYVSNAIKYSGGGTLVDISARLRDDGMVEIAVSDQGPGIPREHLPRIFERFYRVDKARSRELGGTGLGLAIVKHIALVHGGRVEVESTVGTGSTFRLIVPARDGARDRG